MTYKKCLKDDRCRLAFELDQPATKCTYHTDDKYFMTLHISGAVRMYELVDEKLRQVLNIPLKSTKHTANDIAFTNDGGKFVSTHSSGLCQYYDIEHEKCIRYFENRIKGMEFDYDLITTIPNSCTSSMSGGTQKFVVTSTDGMACIMDPRMSTPFVQLFSRPREYVTSVSVSNVSYEDDLIMFTSSEGFVDLYSVKQYGEVDQVDALPHEVLSGCFIEGGDKFVIGTGESAKKTNHLCVYNSRGCEQPVDRVLSGCSGPVTQVLALDGGRRVLAGSMMGEVSLVDMERRRHERYVEGLPLDICSLGVNWSEKEFVAMHDNVLLFYEIAEGAVEGELEEEEEKKKVEKRGKKKKAKVKTGAEDDFFDGLV